MAPEETPRIVSFDHSVFFKSHTLMTASALTVINALLGVGLRQEDIIAMTPCSFVDGIEVTVNTAEARDTLLQKGITIGDTKIEARTEDTPVTYVTIRGFSIRLNDEEIKKLMENFGEVRQISKMTYRDLPSIYNGARLAVMVINKPIPPTLELITLSSDGDAITHTARVTYRGQKQYCFLCGEDDHMKRACPRLQCGKCLERGHSQRECEKDVKCRRCKEEGHMAKYCPKKGNTKTTEFQVKLNIVEDQEDVQTTNPTTAITPTVTPKTPDPTPTQEVSTEQDTIKKTTGRSSRITRNKTKDDGFIFPGSPADIDEAALKKLIEDEKNLRGVYFSKSRTNRIPTKKLQTLVLSRLRELGLRVRDGYIYHPQGYLSRTD